MTKKGKQNLFLYIGIGLFILFFILFVTVNPWFGIGILASMILMGKMMENMSMDRWNNGICAKYDIPWEFSSYSDLSDGDTSYCFICSDESHMFGRGMMHKIMNEYKGLNKLKGL